MQRRPGFDSIETPVPINREKLSYQPPLEVTDKTTKGQIPIIIGWNDMRERLLELGEMESE